MIESRVMGEEKIFYDDLDNDNFSEVIRFLPHTGNKVGVIVHSKGKIIDQWNFCGNLPYFDFSLINDYDKNGFKEIYLLTYQNNSILLNGFEIVKEVRSNLVFPTFIIVTGYDQ